MLFSRPRKGPVAEWLGRALQKLPQRFESARDLDTKPPPIIGGGFFHATQRRKLAFESWGGMKKAKQWWWISSSSPLLERLWVKRVYWSGWATNKMRSSSAESSLSKVGGYYSSYLSFQRLYLLLQYEALSNHRNTTLHSINICNYPTICHHRK